MNVYCNIAAKRLDYDNINTLLQLAVSFGKFCWTQPNLQSARKLYTCQHW